MRTRLSFIRYYSPRTPARSLAGSGNDGPSRRHWESDPRGEETGPAERGCPGQSTGKPRKSPGEASEKPRESPGRTPGKPRPPRGASGSLGESRERTLRQNGGVRRGRGPANPGFGGAQGLIQRFRAEYLSNTAPKRLSEGEEKARFFKFFNIFLAKYLHRIKIRSIFALAIKERRRSLIE